MRLFKLFCNRKIVSGFLVLNLFGFNFYGPAAAWADSGVKNPKVEDLLSTDYVKLAGDDTWHVLSSPARWNEKDWLLAGLGTGAVVATAAWADKPIEKEFQRHRSKSNDDFSKAIQPFGAEYSFAVLGAFELGGLAFHDDNARAAAQDGLASSIVAAGIITPSLKYAVGRKRPSQSASPRHFSPFSGGDSFPSGHTTQAFAVASVIAEHYDSPLIKVGSYGVASMVGYARMERKAHWASDILASALIGTFVGRAIVHFNHDRRYEISMIADGDTVGAQVTHTF